MCIFTNMKLVSANYVYPVCSSPIKNGVVQFDNSGKILAVLNPDVDNINWDNIEKHQGVICPGFVNTHCHLELSYLKNKITEQTLLHGFVNELMRVRENFSNEERLLAIQKADEEMYLNGVVAVGDICNGDSTLIQKQLSKIKYHTFVEVFGLNTSDAEDILNRAKELTNKFSCSSITPHAPYSLSPKLMTLVNQERDSMMTIHNQETPSENELFKNGSGALFNQLSKFSEEIKTWQPTEKTSLQSYLTGFSKQKRVLLVHNTFTNKSDIDFAKNYSKNIYWCFCPNANQYIENTQPNYSLFLDEKCTIGTDSLASNWSLSILDELKTISNKNDKINLETLLKWGTINGAEFLGVDKQLGSLEVGKAPGLNLITHIKNNQLTNKSDVLRIDA